MAATEITRVTYRWDDRPGVEPGWYCESWSGNQMVADSQKVWFPVDADEFGADQASELAEALRGSFPGAEIVRR